MFPRNIRSIYSWKVAQILALIQDSIGKVSWSGDHEAQQRFCKALEDAGLKRPGEQYDPNSGGPRTYYAQLKSLGLLFELPGRNGTKTLQLTRAGEQILAADAPLRVMQIQLLRHQYPSAYGSSIKVNPRLRVKPFLFLLQLIQDPELEGLTYQEMMVPVIYGHSNECLGLCRELILDWRRTGNLRIADPVQDLYTPRTKDRGEQDALKDIKDIANTFKNALESNCLITLGEAGRYVVAPGSTVILAEESSGFDKFLSLENPSQFLREYGKLERTKDTRNLVPNQNRSTPRPGNLLIIGRFMEFCGTRPVVELPEDFIAEMATSFGFSREQVLEAINPLLDRALEIYESTYLAQSVGGAPIATEFELATAAIFNMSFAFTTEHTGQRKRPKGSVGGYADILLLPLEPGKCALIDTKASGQYALGSSDARAMRDYSSQYGELAPGTELEFCAYVAGGFAKNIAERLRLVSADIGVPVSAITSRELLRLAQAMSGHENQTKVRRLFRSGGVKSVPDE